MGYCRTNHFPRRKGTVRNVKQRSKIRLVSGDGARWIKDTVEEYCPNAEFCIDPFHVVAWCTKVLDEVRREEWNKARAELAKEKKEKSGRGRPKGGRKQKSAAEQHVDAVKSSRYSLLMNPENLSETYQTKLKQLLLHDRRLATAYRLKEELRLIFKLSPLSCHPTRCQLPWINGGEGHGRAESSSLLSCKERSSGTRTQSSQP